MGRVHLSADVSMAPEGSDQLTLIFDGITLFDAPFSEFTQCAFNPAIYKLMRRGMLVIFNVQDLILRVFRWSLDLSAIDNSDGVDVELTMGTATGFENILMEQLFRRNLRYVRSD